MKIKSSMFTAFTFKALLIFTCAVFGFANFTACDAQSVVGKWTLASVKGFIIYKNDGKKIDISHAVKGQIVEFKTDNTYTAETPKYNYVVTGTYKLLGNQLEMYPDMKNATAEQKKAIAELPKTSTIAAITANSMTWHYTADVPTYKTDLEETFEKL